MTQQGKLKSSMKWWKQTERIMPKCLFFRTCYTFYLHYLQLLIPVLSSVYNWCKIRISFVSIHYQTHSVTLLDNKKGSTVLCWNISASNKLNEMCYGNSRQWWSVETHPIHVNHSLGSYQLALLLTGRISTTLLFQGEMCYTVSLNQKLAVQKR